MPGPTILGANGRKKEIGGGWRRLGFLWLITLLGLHPAAGQPSINAGKAVRITGHYYCIFRNGAPGITNNFHFIALTGPDTWSISSTNDHNPNDWGQMWSDGTNIYTLASYAGNSPQGHVNAYKLYGYAYPGQLFFPKMQDSTHLFLPWISFHLSPQTVHSFEHNGTIEIPWPWGNTRFVLSGYGYKWMLASSDDDQIQRIDIVRDSALDLQTPEAELHRAVADYPFRISDRDEVLQMLSLRKDVPNGFVYCSYACTNIFNTNNLSIPFNAQFTEYYPNYRGGGSILVREYALTTDQVELTDDANIADLTTPAKTLVSDYRYQASNNRTKFNCATYILNAGDAFKPGDDPALLAQARDWLDHGPGFDNLKSRRSIILIGMIVITTVFTGLLLFRSKTTKNQTHITT